MEEVLMEQAPTPAANKRSAEFILRALGTAVLFALAGALYFSIIGAFEGAIAGLGLGSLMDFSSSRGSSFPEYTFLGIVMGAIVALEIGAAVGAIVFCAVGILASFASDPTAVLWLAVGRAIRGSVIGVVLGAVVGAVNGFLLSVVSPPSYFNGSGIFATSSDVLWDTCLLGIFLGFTIGVMYAAIRGALTEISRQRDKQSQPTLS